MRLAAGSYSAPPDSLDVIRGVRERMGRKGLGIGRGRKGREGHEGVGRDNASTTIYRMKRVAHIDCRA